MNEAVITALITGAVSLVVCLMTNYFQNRKNTTLMEYRIDQLTKQVEKHNNLVERTYHLEEESILHEEKIKVVNHRLDDLEKLEGR